MAVFPSDSIRTKNWGTEVLTDADLEAQLDLLHAYFQAALNSSTGHNHDGTSNQGPKIPITNLTVGSQAQGDVIYASSSSAWTRLGPGTSGQFLKTQGAAANPIWADVSSPSAASQAEMEAATSNTVYATPGRTQNHPGVAKCVILFDGTASDPITPSYAYGISGTTIQKNTTGKYTITFATAFSNANTITVSGSCQYAGTSHGVGVVIDKDTAPTTTTLKINTINYNSNVAVDVARVSVIVHGDQ